jgi:hypothetical protein
MTAPFDTGTGIERAFDSRKDIWPVPGFPCMCIFACKGIRQVDLTVACQEILCMQQLNLGQVSLQGFGERARQHGYTILPSFAIAHSNLMIGKIEVFDAQAHAFHET